MEGILTYKGSVQTWECDSNRHMNVMYYINKFEQAGRNCSFEFGVTKDLLSSSNLGIAVVEQNITYKRELFEDDLVYVKSRPISYTDKVISFRHEMYLASENALSSIMEVKLVFFNLAERKSVSIPQKVKSNVEGFLSEV